MNCRRTIWKSQNNKHDNKYDKKTDCSKYRENLVGTVQMELDTDKHTCYHHGDHQ